VQNLQVMEKLGVEKAFVLGTSQGGWITVRMALLAPEKILGIIPLGTSLDYESDRSRNLGCWHSVESLGKLVTEDFSVKNSGDSFKVNPTPISLPGFTCLTY
jgi:pimeloyl-ACP methyl ester carboxylesterase